MDEEKKLSYLPIRSQQFWKRGGETGNRSDIPQGSKSAIAKPPGGSGKKMSSAGGERVEMWFRGYLTFKRGWKWSYSSSGMIIPRRRRSDACFTKREAGSSKPVKKKDKPVPLLGKQKKDRHAATKIGKGEGGGRGTQKKKK